MIPTPFLASWPSGIRRRTFAPLCSHLPPESNRLSLGWRYSSAPTLCQEVLPPPLCPCYKSDCRTVSIPAKSHQYPAVITHGCEPRPVLRRTARAPMSLQSYNRLDQGVFLRLFEQASLPGPAQFFFVRLFGITSGNPAATASPTPAPSHLTSPDWPPAPGKSCWPRLPGRLPPGCFPAGSDSIGPPS